MSTAAPQDASDVTVLSRLRAAERALRLAYAQVLAAVAEVDGRGFAAAEGYGSTARLLSAVLRIDPAEARRRVSDAAATASRAALTGQPLPPLLPATAAALAAGELGPGQLREITDTIARIPVHVPPGVRERIDEELAGHAARFTPRELRRIGQRILDCVDPDGSAPREPELPPRALHLRDRAGGGLHGCLELDPEGAAVLRAVIGSLNAPTSEDPRSAAERDADALVEACRRLLAVGELPDTGSERPHVAVTVRWETLRDGLSAATRGPATFDPATFDPATFDPATFDSGDRVGAAIARRLCCDAKILPVVLGTHSEPLDVGRISYTVPLPLRRAVITRDRGCAFPGCGRPPSWCHCHHVRSWIDGGETCVDNLTMLCPTHHRLIHHSGWEVQIHHGQPRFRAPEWLDPKREWIHNPLRQ